MEFEAAKCPNCGANIELNPKNTFTNCQFCGSSISVKGAIEAYREEQKKEYRLKMADECLEKGITDDAEEIYRQISKNYPNEYRGWWGIIRCNPVTKGFLSPMAGEYERALAFAPEDKKAEIEKHRHKRLEIIEKHKRLKDLHGIEKDSRSGVASSEYETAKVKGLISEKCIEIEKIKNSIAKLEEENNKYKKRNKILLIASIVFIILAVVLFSISQLLTVCFILAALVCYSSVFSNVMDSKVNKEQINNYTEKALRNANGEYEELQKLLSEKEADYSEKKKALWDIETEREKLCKELGGI